MLNVAAECAKGASEIPCGHCVWRDHSARNLKTGVRVAFVIACCFSQLTRKKKKALFSFCDSFFCDTAKPRAKVPSPLSFYVFSSIAFFMLMLQPYENRTSFSLCSHIDDRLRFFFFLDLQNLFLSFTNRTCSKARSSSEKTSWNHVTVTMTTIFRWHSKGLSFHGVGAFKRQRKKRKEFS